MSSPNKYQHPTNHVILYKGELNLRYYGPITLNNNIQSSKSNKTDRKLRFCELVKTDKRLYLVIYKIKRGNHVYYFKLNLDEHSVVVTSYLKGEYRFYINDDKIAIFDIKSLTERDKWEEILTNSIIDLKSCSDVSSTNLDNSNLSQSIVDVNLNIPNISLISANNSTTDNNTVLPVMMMTSSNIGNNTGRKTSTTVQIGISEPIRKDQRVISGGYGDVKQANDVSQKDSELANMEATTLSDKDSYDHLMSTEEDDMLNQTTSLSVNPMSASYSPKSRLVSHSHRGDALQSSPEPANKIYRAHQVSEISNNRMNQYSSPLMKSNLSMHKAMNETSEVDYNNTTAQGRHLLEQSLHNSSLIQEDLAVAQQSSDTTASIRIGLLKQEMQALSAMNDQLNDALESAEALIKSTEEDHRYQISFLNSILEQTKEEPMKLKSELLSCIEQRDQVKLQLEEIIESMELMTQELNHLQSRSQTDKDIIRSHESEIETLNDIIRTQKEEIRGKDEVINSLNHKNEVDKDSYERQIDVLTSNIDQMTKDLDDYQMTMKSKVSTNFGLSEIDDLKAISMIKQLTGVIKQLTQELAETHSLEESHKLSKKRLEGILHEQKAYEEQLCQQIDHLNAHKIQMNETIRELAECKEDVHRINHEKDYQVKDKEKLQAQYHALEIELQRQRETYERKLEEEQSETMQLRSKNKQYESDDAHLRTEISILQRRIELSKEQNLQFESQLHELRRQQAQNDQYHQKEKASLQESIETSSQVVRDLQNRCKLLEETSQIEQYNHKHKVHEHEELVNELKHTNKDILSRTNILEEQVHKLELSLTSEQFMNKELKQNVIKLEKELLSVNETHLQNISLIEYSLTKSQHSLSETRQQLKDNEHQYRNQTDKANAAYKELSVNLNSAEHANKSLKDDLLRLQAEYQDEIKALQTRLTAQTNLQESLESKNNELIRLLSAVESEKRIMTQQQNTRETQLLAIQTTLTSNKESLETTIQKLKFDYLNIQRTLEDTQRDLDNKVQEYKGLATSHSMQTKSYEDLKDELQKVHALKLKEKEQFQLDIKNITKELQDEQAQAISAKNNFELRIETIENALISTSQKLKKTTTEYDEKKTIYEDQRHMLNQLQNKYQDTLNKFDDIEKINQNNENELMNMKIECNSLSIVKMNQQEKILFLEGELNKITNQYKNTNNELVLLTNRSKELTENSMIQTNLIQEKTIKIQNLEMNCNKYEMECNILTNKADLLQQQLVSNIQALELTESKFTHLEKDIIPELQRTLQEQTTKYKIEHNQNQVEIESLHRMIKQQEQVQQEMESQVTQLETLKNTYTKTIHELLYDISFASTGIRRISSNIDSNNHTATVVDINHTYDNNAMIAQQQQSQNNMDLCKVALESAKGFREMVQSFESQSNSIVYNYLLLKSYVTQLSSSLALELQTLILDNNITNNNTNPSMNNNVQELIKRNEDMFLLLIRNVRNKLTKLTTNITEYEAIKSIQENQIIEQSNQIENIQSQMSALVSNKQSLEQRHALEISSFQQQINQYINQIDRNQEEYNAMIASLTKSQEEQSQRQLIHLNTILDQKLQDEQLKSTRVIKDLELKLESNAKQYRSDVEHNQKDLNVQIEQCQQLKRDCQVKDQEINQLSIRIDSLNAEIDNKTNQLENLLNELEKAELKVAKVAREHMELERVTRRFQIPGNVSIDRDSNMEINRRTDFSRSISSVMDTSYHNSSTNIDQIKTNKYLPSSSETSLLKNSIKYTLNSNTSTPLSIKTSHKDINNSMITNRNGIFNTNHTTPLNNNNSSNNNNTSINYDSNQAGSSVISRASITTNRIENAMQLRGWKLN